ncbi:octopamine receptor-like [Octopus vulgaris]|uniref:Octopamine receptor-like n=3 Tax=Octopus TaxID=6643 RepID=A0AA36BZ59_OCTVU|nr:uncharacterized protein LOC115227278 isoform X1 [Octopus sinensis]CAI9743034.1 octopamine receptor-like [Octopus vulgaris]
MIPSVVNTSSNSLTWNSSKDMNTMSLVSSSSSSLLTMIMANMSSLDGEMSVSTENPPPVSMRWGMLSLVFVIICAASGNLLVCMAVCWERRLQNMTNYFLMSLAIADFLVSILVMPLGMIVEIYGFFPMNPHVCLFWITTDVLMCTASIWHMSTMSMDRFFTLKYPMRYGRNKTKHMVCVKILFVWFVSIAISCPMSINGLLDTRTVYNNGSCLPTLPTFVIYGSVFAFYIPLLIMIVTYALTIQILWDNQNLMKSIEKFDRRPAVKSSGSVKKDVSIISRSQGDGTAENRNRAVLSETDGPDTHIIGISEIGQAGGEGAPSVQNQQQDTKTSRANWTQCDSVRNSFDSAQTTITTCTLGSEQGTNATQANAAEPIPALIDNKKMRRKSLQLPLQKRRCSKVHFERVPSADQVKEEPKPQPLYSSKSYSQIMDINHWKTSSLFKHPLHHSYHGLNNNIINMDFNQSYFHIQDETGINFLGNESQNETEDQLEVGAEASYCRPVMLAKQNAVTSMDEPISVKGESVRIVKTKVNVATETSKVGCTTPEECPEIPEGQQLVAYNAPVGAMNKNCKQDYHTMKRTFRNFIKEHIMRANKKPKIQKAFRHLLSNKTASNEKKALKVLGIIFAVFVVLWTPFFIVNILSATCKDCMSKITPEMMSIFLWMGYIASLANPLIYTMFNTAFRRAFVKILTCKYPCSQRQNTESSCLSFTASWHFDRKNTIMMFLKEELS